MGPSMTAWAERPTHLHDPTSFGFSAADVSAAVLLLLPHGSRCSTCAGRRWPRLQAHPYHVCVQACACPDYVLACCGRGATRMLVLRCVCVCALQSGRATLCADYPHWGASLHPYRGSTGRNKYLTCFMSPCMPRTWAAPPPLQGSSRCSGASPLCPTHTKAGREPHLFGLFPAPRPKCSTIG